MRRFLSMPLCFLAIIASGQRTIDITNNDAAAASSNLFVVVGGTPFVLAKYSKVTEGSPYFKESWLKGTVAVNQGRTYQGIQLKLDLLANEVHYQDSLGTDLVATTPLTRLELIDPENERVFTFVNSYFFNVLPLPKAAWFQVLAEGAASVYEYYEKETQEISPYGSATREQHIITKARHFLLYKNSFAQVKRLKDIAEVLSGKTQALLEYIRNQGLSEKNEEDWSALVNYYNEIQGK
jgi:hypothetical protein